MTEHKKTPQSSHDKQFTTKKNTGLGRFWSELTGVEERETIKILENESQAIRLLANAAQKKMDLEIMALERQHEMTLGVNQQPTQIIPLEDIDNVVNEIANKTNESKIEVLRKAMSLMKIVIEAKEHGYKFGLTKDSKGLDSEISL